MVGTILMALVAGAIVGPLARFVLPGKQHIGVLMTVRVRHTAGAACLLARAAPNGYEGPRQDLPFDSS